VLLLPQVRNLIIKAWEKVVGKELDQNIWMEVQLEFYLLLTIFCLTFSIIFFFRKQPVLETICKYINNYGKIILILAVAGVVVISVIVRIIMYIKCRSLWLDEASLAESIVSRNFFDLLVPPLLNNQSAPVLYVITVKFICSIFGYSESSLRIFSFFSFLGLLICEILLLKKALNLDNFKIAVIAAITSLLPHYIWYSNELKPYMSDAFFVVLTFLLYYYYTQGKIGLPLLTALFILLLGFSSPVIFFTGGILFNELIVAIFNKNKKQVFFIIISGIVVLVVFGLYYNWWLSPVSDYMKIFWGKPKIWELLKIFREGTSGIDSSFIWLFTPFALLGVFFLIKSKNKIAISSFFSLFFIFFASLLGYWPMVSRLWLFLPAIVLIFTPYGIDFIYSKTENKNVVDITEYFLSLVIIVFLLVNCLRYAGDKMYFRNEEVNPLISFVQENIKEDEKLYIYASARNAFEFKNGYSTMKIGDVAKDNIIYGKDSSEWNKNFVGDELRSILENKKIYLLFQHNHIENINIKNALSVLENYGTIKEIMNVYDTPFYFFELDGK
jgi:hypothetical protein